MIYKEFAGIKLSALGMGTMRLPVKGENNGEIDIQRTKEMVKYALDHGINYFDTAWMYHNGNSELVMGEVLSEYPRDSFYLASKFPGFSLDSVINHKEIFERQLEKCRVDYFDFYLFHNVCEKNIDWYLDSQYGLFDYLMEQKAAGRIRHLGFSAHGSVEVLRRFLEKYGDAIEFGQLQINWLDWDYQNAKGKYELFCEYNIPVWVMEPVRGGRLAKLSCEDEALLRALRADEGIPAWSFRFLQGLPAVTMVLSGMSNYEQLCENIATYESEKPLTDEELEVIFGIARRMVEKAALPCTACRYCTEKCPRGLDIPKLIEIYNENRFKNEDGSIGASVISEIEEKKLPMACVGCRRCEKLCPQGIKISEVMRDFAGRISK